MTHNRWLAWKMKRGLASRGRAGPLSPRGFLARILYRVHFHKCEPRAPRVFKQTVGGTLGPVGKCNGE